MSTAAERIAAKVYRSIYGGDTRWTGKRKAIEDIVAAELEPVYSAAREAFKQTKDDDLRTRLAEALGPFVGPATE